ncbi:hypothetical protein DFQ14_101275 [Halopolyspora algeriensis]|uniref:Uncharacterized protein n=1 Tax=Halopolyspora algeriensis TaxID=1500506 RepID=A0A368VYD3_9ACTN|nr:hypothetical protein [Halopolyspora algeriensis]RCW46935.1 hypothetical protein DFQ14_101275 [Halopolyspora algeriensis]TQM48026.1 hypothetical protein FHU43_2978 [Halopolyspora algeriensis]
MAVVVEGQNAVDHLSRMGLSVAPFHQALRAGYAESLTPSGFAPPGFANYLLDGWTAEALRRILCGRRDNPWTPDDTYNLRRVVEPTGEFGIIPSIGTATTGRSRSTPTTHNERGPATSRAVSENQLALDLALRMTDDEPEPITWNFLYYVDEGERVIRSELSLPRRIWRSRVRSWKPRILLPELNLDGPATLEDDQPAPDPIDVSVAWR